MGPIWFAANAKGIPYDSWWAAWGVIAFIVAPVMIIAVVVGRPRGQRSLLLAVVLPTPLLLGLVISNIAMSCHSFGLYAPRGCDPSGATIAGWLAIGAAMAALIGVAVALDREHLPPQDRVRRDVITGDRR